MSLAFFYGIPPFTFFPLSEPSKTDVFNAYSRISSIGSEGTAISIDRKSVQNLAVISIVS
jgi:hypothetical protein